MQQASTVVNKGNGRRQWPQSLQYRFSMGDINLSRIERWGSVVGGTALALYGLKHRSLGGIVVSLLGAGLAYRGVSGHCPLYSALDISTATEDTGAQRGIHVEKTMTILKAPEELYRFWRRFENLPRFMRHVQSVRSLDHERSHWVAKAPLGTTIEWDAEIIEDREHEVIAWRSVEGSQLPNDGRVLFRRDPAGRGTQVKAMLTYYPPLGKIAAIGAKLFGEDPGQQLEEDLRRFKCLMEAGEIPTVEGQPSGRVAPEAEEPAGRRRKPLEGWKDRDVVAQASMDSFPASDAPAWTFRREAN